jgi:hypothetical protein
MHFNPEDKTDRAVRRFAADWLKRNVKDVGVDTRIETFPPGMFWQNDETGETTAITGAIRISWWPRPPESEFDRWKREVAEKRRQVVPNVEES